MPAGTSWHSFGLPPALPFVLPLALPFSTTAHRLRKNYFVIVINTKNMLTQQYFKFVEKSFLKKHYIKSSVMSSTPSCYRSYASASPYISSFMVCLEYLSVCMDCWNFCNFRKAVKAFNPFVPNAPFFYPLKTSEYRKVFWRFQGVEKGCIGNEWVNKLICCPI